MEGIDNNRILPAFPHAECERYSIPPEILLRSSRWSGDGSFHPTTTENLASFIQYCYRCGLGSGAVFLQMLGLPQWGGAEMPAKKLAKSAASLSAHQHAARPQGRTPRAAPRSLAAGGISTARLLGRTTGGGVLHKPLAELMPFESRALSLKEF